MEYNALIFGLVAVLTAFLLAFTLTPPVRVLAFKLGAIDIPKDDRRMHKESIPRIGGLAIFAGFVLTTLIFCEISHELIAIWFGGLVIVISGVLDDIYHLNPFLKLLFQIAAAVIAVAQGVVIRQVNFFGTYVSFGVFAIPLTVCWIIGLTNAINLIDGLDGLACGVSSICSISILVVLLLVEDYASALIIAILVGACFGFLPFNANPAKIFMGDTGALFLGYTMALISVQGMFKLHTVVSFMIPLSIFALPLFDTFMAFFRRLLHGKNPFVGDRGHLHHRLVDMGFSHKQAVWVLYAVSGLLGISSILFTGKLFTENSLIRTLVVIVSAVGVFALNFIILKDRNMRMHSGLLAKKAKDADTQKTADVQEKTEDDPEKS